MADASPILIAYDGSPQAQAALATAAKVFPGRAAIIATVWEPGLASVVPDPAGIGGPAAPVDLGAVAEVDDIMSKRAAGIAADGVQRAQAAGLQPTPVSTEDDSNVAETIAAIADEHAADVVVVGSRGLSGIKARLLGSTSESILHHCGRPVLVVREPPGERSS
jgi:nucleotide-binding universal stress UspA family protein